MNPNIVLSKYLNFYVLSPLRRRFVLIELRKRAMERGQEQLLPAIEKAITHAEDIVARTQIRQRKAKASARQLDRRIDRLLSLIYNTLNHYAEFTEDSEAAELVTMIFRQAFPNGLAAHVNRVHSEQAILNLDVLMLLSRDEYQPILRKIGVAAHLEPLQEMVTEFMNVAKLDDDLLVSQSQTRETAAEGHELYLDVLVKIMSGDDPELRSYLLLPAVAENMQVRLHRMRRRRAGTDDFTDNSEDTADTSENASDDFPDTSGNGDVSDNPPMNDDSSATDTGSEADASDHEDTLPPPTKNDPTRMGASRNQVA